MVVVVSSGARCVDVGVTFIIICVTASSSSIIYVYHGQLLLNNTPATRKLAEALDEGAYPMDHEGSLRR